MPIGIRDLELSIAIELAPRTSEHCRDELDLIVKSKDLLSGQPKVYGPGIRVHGASPFARRDALQHDFGAVPGDNGKFIWRLIREALRLKPQNALVPFDAAVYVRHS